MTISERLGSQTSSSSFIEEDDEEQKDSYSGISRLAKEKGWVEEEKGFDWGGLVGKVGEVAGKAWDKTAPLRESGLIGVGLPSDIVAKNLPQATIKEPSMPEGTKSMAGFVPLTENFDVADGLYPIKRALYETAKGVPYVPRKYVKFEDLPREKSSTEKEAEFAAQTGGAVLSQLGVLGAAGKALAGSQAIQSLGSVSPLAAQGATTLGSLSTSSALRQAAQDKPIEDKIKDFALQDLPSDVAFAVATMASGGVAGAFKGNKPIGKLTIEGLLKLKNLGVPITPKVARATYNVATEVASRALSGSVGAGAYTGVKKLTGQEPELSDAVVSFVYGAMQGKAVPYYQKTEPLVRPAGRIAEPPKPTTAIVPTRPIQPQPTAPIAQTPIQNAIIAQKPSISQGIAPVSTPPLIPPTGVAPEAIKPPVIETVEPAPPQGVKGVEMFHGTDSKIVGELKANAKSSEQFYGQGVYYKPTEQGAAKYGKNISKHTVDTTGFLDLRGKSPMDRQAITGTVGTYDQFLEMIGGKDTPANFREYLSRQKQVSDDLVKQGYKGVIDDTQIVKFSTSSITEKSPQGVKLYRAKDYSSGYAELGNGVYGAEKPEYAKLFGKDIEELTISPNAKIIKEDSPEFESLYRAVENRKTGQIDPELARKVAKARGIDGIKGIDPDTGTVIFNDDIIVSRKSLSTSTPTPTEGVGKAVAPKPTTITPETPKAVIDKKISKAKAEGGGLIPDKPRLMEAVKQAIEKAPEVGDKGDYIYFKIDGGARILNNKEALTKFYDALKKTPQKVSGIEKKLDAMARKGTYGYSRMPEPEGYKEALIEQTSGTEPKGTAEISKEPMLTPQEKVELDKALNSKSRGGFVSLGSSTKEKFNLTDDIDVSLEDLKSDISGFELAKQYAGDKIKDLKNAIHSAELAQNYLYAYEDSRPVAEGVIDAFTKMLKSEADANEFLTASRLAKHPEVLAEIAVKADRNPNVNPFVLLAEAKKAGKINMLDELAFKHGLYYLVKNRRDILVDEILQSRIGVRAKSNGARYNVTYELKNGKLSTRKNVSSGMFDSIEKKFNVTNIEELGEEVIFKHRDPNTGEYKTRKVMVRDYAEEVPKLLKAEEQALIKDILPYGPANYIPHNRRGGNTWVEGFDIGDDGKPVKVFSARVPNDAYAKALVERAKQKLPGVEFTTKPHDYKMKNIPSFGSISDVQIFLEQNGIDITSEPGQKIINAYRAMSPLMSSLIQSQNLKGFKTDWKSITDEAYSGLIQAIKRQNRLDVKDLNGELKNIKDDFRYNVASKYIGDLTSQEAGRGMLTSIADGTKGLVYTIYLANSLTYTLQNMTEAIWAIAPAIDSMKSPLGLIRPLSSEYKVLVDKAVKEGILKPFFDISLTDNDLFSKIDIIGKLSESFSSKQVFEIGLKVARDKGLTGEEAYREAVQFLFNKGKPFYDHANSPIFMQGDRWGVVRKYGFMLLRWITNFYNRFARASIRGKIITALGTIILGGLPSILGGRAILKAAGFNFKKRPDKYSLTEKFMLGGMPALAGIDPSFLRPVLMIKGIGDFPSAFKQFNLLGQKADQVKRNYAKYGLAGGLGSSMAMLRPLIGMQQAEKGVVEKTGRRKKIIYKPKGAEKEVLRFGLTPFSLGEFYKRKYGD